MFIFLFGIHRDVLSESNAYALAVKQPDGTLGNFLIENTREGWRVRGTTVSFQALSDLIAYYAKAMRISLGPLLRCA